MTFLSPVFMMLGLGVAGLAVALHFLVTRQPPSHPLPTARFVPEGSVRVPTVARPTDLLVLVLRILLAVVVGAAFARPVFEPNRRPVLRLVAADVSGGEASIAAVRDSAKAWVRAGDVLIPFDSAAHAIERGAVDSLRVLVPSRRPGHVSSALIVALRTASKIRATADSFELVLISPFRAAEIDGATASIRKLWPGRIHLVTIPVSVASTPSVAPGFAVRAAADDPVALAAVLARTGPGEAKANPAVWIVRQPMTAADSAWAAGHGHTLVYWPTEGAPPGWVRRDTIDTVGAVVADSTVLVFPFERRWRLAPTARPARVTARWVDGEPAAADFPLGNGCLRQVAVPLPSRGDLVLRPTFARLFAALGAPCAGGPDGAPAEPETLAMLAGAGPLAAAAAMTKPDTSATPLVPWLLVLAAGLALTELVVRRRKP